MTPQDKNEYAEQYETELKSQVNEFYRLAQECGFTDLQARFIWIALRKLKIEIDNN